jgi:hypothetical protein
MLCNIGSINIEGQTLGILVLYSLKPETILFAV